MKCSIAVINTSLVGTESRLWRLCQFKFMKIGKNKGKDYLNSLRKCKQPTQMRTLMKLCKMF